MIFTPADFVDLGARAAVDQALSRLVKAGTLRRVGRGLMTGRARQLLGGDAPAAADDVAAAAARRVGATAAPRSGGGQRSWGSPRPCCRGPPIWPAANLATAPWGRCASSFGRAAKLAPLLNTDAAVMVQALAWARDSGFDLNEAAAEIARTASDAATSALAANLRRLPVWALGPAREILSRYSWHIERLRGRSLSRSINSAYAEFDALEARDRRDAFNAAAQSLGASVQAIEKDFWVCRSIDAMFMGFGRSARPKLYFKGYICSPRATASSSASRKTSILWCRGAG